MNENLKEFKLDYFFTLIRRKIQRIDMIVKIRKASVIKKIPLIKRKSKSLCTKIFTLIINFEWKIIIEVVERIKLSFTQFYKVICTLVLNLNFFLLTKIINWNNISHLSNF